MAHQFQCHTKLYNSIVQCVIFSNTLQEANASGFAGLMLMMLYNCLSSWVMLTHDPTPTSRTSEALSFQSSPDAFDVFINIFSGARGSCARLRGPACDSEFCSEIGRACVEELVDCERNMWGYMLYMWVMHVSRMNVCWSFFPFSMNLWALKYSFCSLGGQSVEFCCLCEAFEIWREKSLIHKNNHFGVM